MRDFQAIIIHEKVIKLKLEKDKTRTNVLKTLPKQ